jgi:hypothetical protein
MNLWKGNVGDVRDVSAQRANSGKFLFSISDERSRMTLVELRTEP